MKKIILSLFILLLLLPACSDNSKRTNLKDITEDYSLERAKEDNCLIMENGDVTSGRDEFNNFFGCYFQKKKRYDTHSKLLYNRR